jgi:hypothetical protein
MNWFTRLWRQRPTRAALLTASFRPTVEGLDERVMPAVFGRSQLFAGAAHFGAFDAGGEDSDDANETRLTATLTGATGTSGHARYHANATEGTSGLSLRVSGLAASSTFTVQIGGATVGQITTDADGDGKLHLSNLTATVAAGTNITVLDSTGATVLSGTFAAPEATVTKLHADLTGATGTSGHARYHADATAGTNSLTLKVSGLAASVTFTVKIGGTTVGQITTDANGKGRVTFTNLTATVAAGTAITVLDSTGATVLSGTFVAGGGEGEGCHHGHDS